MLNKKFNYIIVYKKKMLLGINLENDFCFTAIHRKNICSVKIIFV